MRLLHSNQETRPLTPVTREHVTRREPRDTEEGHVTGNEAVRTKQRPLVPCADGAVTTEVDHEVFWGLKTLLSPEVRSLKTLLSLEVRSLKTLLSLEVALEYTRKEPSWVLKYSQSLQPNVGRLWTGTKPS
ncbi:hypothetical protein EYF80_020203 [Liparis tanakae]|uniref:Uncharacterized protein n=1 Tax=Liparis tanakae TaxID=230148 RepID=A0A4Z2HV64_9TELE|nr:hypothetical protein EYF80_020203 [Liparis tanakae]